MATKLMFNNIERAMYPLAWQDCESTGEWKIEESEGNVDLYLKVGIGKHFSTRYEYKSITERRLFPFLYLIPTTRKEYTSTGEYDEWYADEKWVHEKDLKVVTVNEFNCGGY